MINVRTETRDEFVGTLALVGKQLYAIDKLIAVAIGRGYRINPYRATIQSVINQIVEMEDRQSDDVKWKADIFSY